MTDIALVWQTDHADVVPQGADLLSDDGLDTAVTLSLFCDRRARDDDSVPVDLDPRGWWADSFSDVPDDEMGSRLWLLGREKALPATAERAITYAQEALAWIVDDGIASSVTVSAAFVERGYLDMQVAIQRPGKPPFNRRYQYVWSAY